MSRYLENDKIHMHQEDAISTKIWVDKLREDNTRVFYKDKLDSPPPESTLEEDVFILCIQTPFQLDAFRRLGNDFIGIDATHNVTHYKDIQLSTIIARDRWGHGVPVAWMLTSRMTSATISFFLSWVQSASPDIRPAVIMTDRDYAQIKALRAVYPQSRIFLCKWHVLRAIQSHFVTTEFPVLWDWIKEWVSTDDLIRFIDLWFKIATDPSVPKSVVQYLATEWMPEVHMWSRLGRKGRSIFQEGDTNMLIERYVNDLYQLIR